jgi:hypothetical protein
MALIFKSRDLSMNTKLRMLRCYSLSSERLVDIKITKFYVEKVPGDQEGLFKLAIQLTTFFLFGYLQHCNWICFVGLFDRYLT